MIREVKNIIERVWSKEGEGAELIITFTHKFIYKDPADGPQLSDWVEPNEGAIVIPTKPSEDINGLTYAIAFMTLVAAVAEDLENIPEERWRSIYAYATDYETQEIRKDCEKAKGLLNCTLFNAFAMSISAPSSADKGVQTTAPVTPTRLPQLPTSTPIPALADLRSYFLQLINRDRAANGLSSVTLGDNPAAQQHAEEMLEHSYAGHWGLDGLKPYMRYTLAGGVNYEAENTSGVKTVPDPNLRYRTTTPKEGIREAQEGLMASPGHRANILRTWHKKVNLGIACNLITCAVVQQFEGDYINFDSRPAFASGVLLLSGHMSGGFEPSGVQIWYDPPPHPVSLGRLDTTSSYCSGRPVAFLRPLPPPGSYYPNVIPLPYKWTDCHSPYDAPEDIQRPGIFIPSKSLSQSAHVPWITGSWQIVGEKFLIQGDLSAILKEYGPGVYTVHVWGNDAVRLSNFSIFYEGE